ncbi:MAG: GNAT family N-acetyltransferase [Ponticaulis sp.]|nr:GNAT family N-acetyltransferase [Ponticaulis sp.]
MIVYEREIPDRDGRDIERLFDATFGPGHFAKTAERVREYSYSLPEITRIGLYNGRLVAVCRVWPIYIGGTEALFYGPIAVAPEHQGGRIGQDVTEAALAAGKKAGHEFACLIGAPAYFSRVGFEVATAGSVRFPGPQDQKRVMLRRLAASDDTPFPEGEVTAPLDAMRAEATQRAYLQRARQAE